MNKTFLRRLKTYLIGVGIGSILVFVLFKERTSQLTAWTPKNTVIKAISTSEWQMNSVDSCYFSCLSLNEKDKKAMLDKADVLFSQSESKIDQENRFYMLSLEDLAVKHLKVNFINDSLISFSNWKLMDGKDCNCD